MIASNVLPSLGYLKYIGILSFESSGLYSPNFSPFVASFITLPIELIFTPNLDGDNDTFVVSAVGADEFELIVFDRWGKQVFRTTDPNEGWDGTYQGGMLAEQSVYSYKVIYYNGDVGEKIQTGTVTLVK